MQNVARTLVHLVLLGALASSAVGAPRSAAAATPTLTPPRAEGPLEAPYPQGATGAATVVLEIVVSRDGNATNGRVIEGDEPFASAALGAMASFRFAPATRDGAPIAARIRVRVRFEPPPASPPPSDPPSRPADAAVTASPSAPAVTPPPAPAPPPPPPEIVNVRVPPPPIGRTVIDAEAIRQMPGAFGEPARAVESLPGVTPYVSGLPFVSVRGAMPSATAYTLDGIRLPNVFHYGLGVTVFHPALLESFDFFSGAPPAREGRAFGLVAGVTRPPAARAHVEATVRAVDSSLLAETPLLDDRASVLVAGRYGYAGTTVHALSPRTTLDYANYQARLTYAVGDAGTLTATALGAHDVFSTTDGGLAAALSDVDVWSHRLDLRYDTRLRDTGSARVGITFGRDIDAPLWSSVDSLQLRADVDVPITDALRVRGGVDSYYSRLRIDSGSIPQRLDDLSSNEAQRVLVRAFLLSATSLGGTERSAHGAWVDAVIRLGKRVELVPGVRVDKFAGAYTTVVSGPSQPFADSIDSLAVSPRFAARVGLVKDIAFVASGGMAARQPSAALPSPASDHITLATAGALERETTFDMGVQMRVPGNASLRAVAFNNVYANMNLWPVCVSQTVCHADGVARGVEVLLRRDPDERLGFWASYTLEFATLHAPGAPSFEDPLARRHTLSGMLSYDLGAGVRVGGRGQIYSGAPFATTTDFVGGKPQWEYVTLSSQTPPPFWRIDARVEKRWTLSPTASVAIALEWLNATLNRESELVCRRHDNGPLQCGESLRPLLSVPSVAIEGRI